MSSTRNSTSEKISTIGFFISAIGTLIGIVISILAPDWVENVVDVAPVFQIVALAFLIIGFIYVENWVYPNNRKLWLYRIPIRGYFVILFVIGLVILKGNLDRKSNAYNVFEDCDAPVKVLVLPFLSKTETDKDVVEIGHAITKILNTHIDSSENRKKICIKYWDETEKYRKSVINKRKYVSDTYIQNIIDKTGCSYIVYGEARLDDSIEYYWKTSSTLKVKLTSDYINPHLITGQSPNSNIEDIYSGRIIACTDLVLSFASLQIDFFSFSYLDAYKQYYKILGSNFCKDCSVSIASFFIAGQSALKLKNDSLIQAVLSNPSSPLLHCKLSKVDSARYYTLLSWLNVERSFLQYGLNYADSAISLLGQSSKLDTSTYIVASLLKAYAFNRGSSPDSAISICHSVLALSSRFPELALANYIDLGAFYATYTKNDKYYIDSSFHYLNLAELKNRIVNDSSSTYLIWNNLIFNYYSLNFSNIKSDKKYSKKEISNKIKLYRGLMESFELRYSAGNEGGNDKRLLERMCNNVTMSMMSSIANNDTNQKRLDEIKHDLLHAIHVLEKELQNSELLIAKHFELTAYFTILDKNIDSAIFYAYNINEIIASSRLPVYYYEVGAYNILSLNYLNKYKLTKTQKDLLDSSIKYSEIGILTSKKHLDDPQVKNYSYPNFMINKKEAENLKID